MSDHNNMFVVVGKSGTGKSWYTRWIVKQYRKKNAKKRIVYIDCHNDSYHKGLRSLGFKYQQVSPQLLGKQFDFVQYFQSNPLVFFDFYGWASDAELVPFLDQIAESLFVLGDTLLVIDEAHFFFPRIKFSQGLARLFRAGRKYGIDILMTTQMVVDLNIIAIKQASHLIAFQLTEENELKKIGQYFHDGYDRLPLLKKTYYLCKDMQRGREEMRTSRSL